MVNTFCEAPARFWSGSESGYKRDELVTTSHRIGSFSILSELTRFPKQDYPTAKGLDLREYLSHRGAEGEEETFTLEKKCLEASPRLSVLGQSSTHLCVSSETPDSRPRGGDALVASLLVFPPLYKSLPHILLHALLLEVSVLVVFILTVQIRLY